MVKPSIEKLFVTEKSFAKTGEWAKTLRDKKEKYATCRVVNFTRMKNLNSDWKHEYVQFIVEEENTKERARVYAERGNEVDLDWVTLGPAETEQTGSKGGKDLPLPLISLVFGGPSGTEVDKRPTVNEIAEILAATTIVGGGYELYGHSCFWYSYTTYDAVKRQFGKWATEKAWRAFDVGGAGGGRVKDAFSLGWTMMFKWYYVGDATKFKKERETGLNWYGEDRDLIDPETIVKKIESNLQDESTRSEYISGLKDQGIVVDNTQIDQALKATEDEAKKASGSADYTKEFDELNSEFVDKAFASGDAQKYLDYYASFEVPKFMAYSPPEGSGPKAEDLKQSFQALQITVGRILEVANKQG